MFEAAPIMRILTARTFTVPSGRHFTGIPLIIAPFAPSVWQVELALAEFPIFNSG